MSNTNVRTTAAGIALLMAALTAWCIAMAGPVSLPPAMRPELAEAARGLAAGLFLAAGAGRLVWWRQTGSDWAAFRAVELLVIGTALPAAVVVASAMHRGPLATLTPPARLIILLPVFAVLVIGAVARNRPTTRQVSLAVATLAGGTLGIVAVVSLLAAHTMSSGHLTAVWLYVEATAAAGWTTAAVLTWRHRAGGPQTLPWVILAMLLMAVVEGIKAAAVEQPTAMIGVATGFQLAAAVLTAVAATSDVVHTLTTEHRQARELTRALSQTQRELAEVELRERQRRHDARSAIVGALGASALLAEPAVNASVLREVIEAELDRLRVMLADETAEPIQAFAVAEALEPVVLAHQIDGTTVRAALGDARAMGRPRALATAFDNVLTNARTHGHAASIEVRVVRLGGTLAITIDDDGPGIPPAERARVLEPGLRGSTAVGDGSGLGLPSAARAMAEQGGTMRILGRIGGGTRAVLAIPAAEPVFAGTAIAS